MAKLKKDDLEIESSLPAEINSLKAQGFKEVTQDKGDTRPASSDAGSKEVGRADASKPATKSTK